MSRAQAARARAGARRGAGRGAGGLPRGYAGTLLAMFYGLAVAVLVVAVGVGSLLTEGIKAGPAGSDESVAAGGSEHERGLAASPAEIDLTATNLGNLRVGIEARVTMNAEKRPLGQARVEVYLDMTAMPGAHTQGPLALRPAGEPGVYTTVATVPMVGDYEVRAEMHDPVHAEATTVVSVGVVGSGR